MGEKTCRGSSGPAATWRVLGDTGYAHEIEPTASRHTSAGGAPWRRLGQATSETGSTATAATLAPLSPRATLTEAVAAAHEGARVTAHCFGEESLRDFAAAGTDCIEHACGLDDETIALFATQGVAIVPTLVNIATFPESRTAPTKFPAYGDHLVALHGRRYRTVAAARKAGIRVYVGTDAGGSLPRHGLVAQEMVSRPGGSVADRGDRGGDLGGPQRLGRSGIEEGSPADLVVYDTTLAPTFAPLLIPGTSSCAGRSCGADGPQSRPASRFPSIPTEPLG